MFVQDFEIHLIDGSVLPVSEPFEIEDDDSLGSLMLIRMKCFVSATVSGDLHWFR